MRGADERLQREQNARGWLAWHVAALSRARKLPDLEKVMVRPPRPPLPQAPSEVDHARVRGWFIARALRDKRGA